MPTFAHRNVHPICHRTYGIFPVCWLLVCAGAAIADEPPQPEWTDVLIAPQAVSQPVLGVRIFPDATKRHGGDAAPIFLRFLWEHQNGWDYEVFEETEAQLKTPLKDFDPAAARADVRFFQFDDLKRAAFASHADWNYPQYEATPLANIRLSDIQAARETLRVLAVDCRADAAEGKIDDALEKLQIGFGLIHHLQQTPFLMVKVNQVACARPLLDRCTELAAHEDSPNLYWALAALPRPLVSLTPTVDWERATLESWSPELRGLDRPRTLPQWQEAADILVEALEDFSDKPGWKERLFNDKHIHRARTDLKQLLPPGAGIEDASDAEIVVRQFLLRYRRELDGTLSLLLLPPHEAIPRLEQRRSAEPSLKTEAAEFVDSMTPLIFLYSSYVWSLQRNIAAQQIVEALRDHAAHHNGKLPESLDELALQAPRDVMTGQRFEYHLRDGEAYLSAPSIDVDGDGEPRHGLRYRIHCREDE